MSGVEIIGLVLNASDVSFRVISAAVDYGQKVKGAARQTEAIRNEVQDVSKMLDNLHLRAKEAKESKDALKHWLSLKEIDSRGSPLTQIRLELNVLLDLLSARKMSKIEQLLWPRKLKKIEKSLCLIAKQKEVLMQNMTVDTGFQTIEMDKRMSELAQKSQDSTLKRNIECLIDYDHTLYHREASNERMDTTGEWIFGLPEFVNWRQKKGKMLWVCGSAGSGKTILCSTIINNISLDCKRDLAKVIAYFYFKDGQRQQAHDMLRSIIKQICMKVSTLSETAIDQLQQFGTSGERPDDAELIGLLQTIAKNVGTIYVVIDALDECIERRRVLNLLASLSDLPLPNVRILVTTRDLVDIRRILEPLVDAEIPIGSAKRKIWEQQPNGIQDDIALYVERSLTEQYYLEMRNDEVKRKIREKLVRRADGMFRWVSCQIDQLSEPLSDEDLLEALDNLPKDLDETYERMLRTILNKKNDHVYPRMVYNLLRWMVATSSPLSIEEATQAVLQSPNDCSLNRRLPSLDATLEMCAGLVKSVDGLIGVTVEFVHYSVKEYLLSERILKSPVSFFAINERDSYRDLTKICISFMFLFDQVEFAIPKILKDHPFLPYACERWDHYLEYGDAQEDESVMNLVNKFLDVNRQRFHIMSRALTYFPDIRRPTLRCCEVKQACTFSDLQLYDAVKYGLVANVQSLLQGGADPNSGNDSIGYALHVAVRKENTEFVQLLIEYKADVNLEAKNHGTPLAIASEIGNLIIIKILLNSGANPDPSLEHSPLKKACERGRKSVVQILLDKGIDQETCDSALLKAIEKKYSDIFDIFMDHRSDKSSPQNIPPDALLKACGVGDGYIVRRLIEAGSDIQYQSPLSEYTALYLAVKRGYEEIVDFLLDNGADANEKVEPDKSILSYAAGQESAKIVEALIAHGADPHFWSADEETALGCAVSSDCLSIVKTLLKHNVDIHAPMNKDMYSAFFYAIHFRRIEIVKLFLDHGIDLDREGGKYGGCVIQAILNGLNEIVDRLISSESRIDILAQHFGHLLHGATAIGDKELVKSCLDSGEDPNMVAESSTPLQIAAMNNRLSVAELLLDRGADVNQSTDLDDNPLHNAASKGHEEMCSLLIERGALVNRVQGQFGTPLKAATVNRRYGVLELLIQHGADVNLSEGNHDHPLQAALKLESSIYEELLKHGADPNFHGGEYGSVLQAVCSYGSDLDSIMSILDRDVDINYTGGNHPSPIELIYERNCDILVQRMLARGANIPPSLEGIIKPEPNTLW